MRSDLKMSLTGRFHIPLTCSTAADTRIICMGSSSCIPIKGAV